MTDKKDNFYEAMIRRNNIFVIIVSLLILLLFGALSFARWWYGGVSGLPF